MPKISHPQRLIYRMPCQRRTKWNSQFTQEQVSISSFLARNAEPSHDIPYQCSAFFISNATCPGMPEFAKSEFSVIRLHEVKIMWNIRKQQWEKFFFLELGERLPICIACAQDFIWLHDVIQENLQYAGFIIPPKVRVAFILNDSLM